MADLEKSTAAAPARNAEAQTDIESLPALFGRLSDGVTALRNNNNGIEIDVENLGPMMQKIHGSVAKLVNDLLPARITPF